MSYDGDMGYDLMKRSGLNFGQGRRTLLQSFVPKGKAPDYYHQTRRGLGYVSTPIPSGSEYEESLYHDYSSDTSSWELDIRLGTLFEGLSVNMVSTSLLEDEDKDEEMIQPDINPWIKHLNTLWDIRFEQREPPTDDKVIQINLGDEVNPKPIFINESLPLSDKENLVHLIQEYIDVFAWNFEDMPRLDPQAAMHCLNINSDMKPVKQHQRRFHPEIMKAIESEVKKLIDSDSLGKNNTLTG